jgi:hypothetical protein
MEAVKFTSAGHQSGTGMSFESFIRFASALKYSRKMGFSPALFQGSLYYSLKTKEKL